MLKSDWDQIKHFTKDENWGDSSLINLELIKELDALRDYLKTAIVITSGTKGTHEPTSNHYTGYAVDVVVPGRNLLDTWIDANRFAFTGIGFYPGWTYESKVVGGLHLEKVTKQPFKKLWMGIGTEKWNMQYVGMNAENLKAFYV